DGTLHEIDAQRRPVFTKTSPSPHVGRYTVAIRAPDGADAALEPAGDGYGAMTVSYLGTCSGLLMLSDGTRTSAAGHFSRDSEWSVYRPLYSGVAGGLLAGKLTARADAGVSDIDGSLRWIKPDGARPTTIYPAGFDSVREVIANRYAAPAKGERAFETLADGYYNGWLRFDGLSAPGIDLAVTWTAANAILYYGPEKVLISFNYKTGLFSGSYSDPVTATNFRFGGALLDGQQLAVGYYLLDGQSGLTTIQAP
ncbi:MAG: hypothetical protein KDM64_07365, partial [Verrucomicrobiae bacterium]|nr:hypothetical protein [Verrucomicrobiae bacterium]